MTPWNVLNSSAVAPFNEPCNNQCYFDGSEDGVTSQLRRSHLACYLSSLSKCESPYSMAQCTLHVCWFLLHGFLPFELCYGCSLQPSRARAFGKVCILSPMKLGVLQTFYLFATAEWMAYTWSANHLERQYRLPPPAGGLLGTPDHRDITNNRGWTTPVRISCGLLHKYI